MRWLYHRSPGFALSLAAESTTRSVVAAEQLAEKGTLPEDIGRLVARQLCEEIKYGGCIDSACQPLALFLMIATPEDVSKLRIGTLAPQR